MKDIIKEAAQFARTAHESVGQRRKYTNEPYIVHPAAVADIVSSVSDDPVVIASAWLHDVVEDTPVSIEEIKDKFGSNVALLVSHLTKASKLSDGDREKRRAIDRQHLSTADSRAKTIKLADIIDNLSNIVELDSKFATIYVAEKEQLLPVLREGDSALFQKAELIIFDAKAKLAK